MPSSSTSSAIAITIGGVGVCIRHTCLYVIRIVAATLRLSDVSIIVSCTSCECVCVRVWTIRMPSVIVLKKRLLNGRSFGVCFIFSFSSFIVIDNKLRARFSYHKHLKMVRMNKKNHADSQAL